MGAVAAVRLLASKPVHAAATELMVAVEEAVGLPSRSSRARRDSDLSAGTSSGSPYPWRNIPS